LGLKSKDEMQRVKDSDCGGDGWEICSTRSGKCIQPQKSCPNDCSNAGDCEYVMKHDSTVTLAECGIFELDCVPRCVCWPGYQGTSCNYHNEDFQSVLESRHLLVESLGRLSALQDLSVSAVLSWIIGLSSISADSNLLRNDTKIKMAELSLNYLQACKEYGLTAEDIWPIGVILDLVLDVDVDVDGANSSVSALSLLDAYNEFILADMVVGQNPSIVLNRMFRTAHYSIDHSLVENQTFAPPRSPLEQYLDQPYQSATFPANVMNGVSKLSIMESAYLRKANQSINLVGTPIELKFDSIPCNSSDAFCFTQITLRKFSSNNNDQNNYHRALSDVPYVDLECVAGDSTIHNLSCPTGELVRLPCPGSSGVLRHYCSFHNTTTVCSSLLGNEDCKVLFNDETSITCDCPLKKNLSYTSDHLMDDSSSTISFGVLTRSLSHEFVDTWLSSSDLTGRQILNNLTVLFSTIGVSIMGGFVMFLAFILDQRDKKLMWSKVSQSAMSAMTPVTKRSIASFIQSSLSSTAKKKPQRLYHHPRSSNNVIGLKEEKRIEESLPLVMRPVPLLEKCKNELKVYHRWLGVYYHYSSAYSRPLRVLSLWINIVTMLFIQSVLYNVADPDDGTCERQETMSDCLKVQSSLSNSPECVWSEESDPQCSFRPIHNDFNRVLIVAMLSGLLSSPFSIFFQSLILFVLSADTKTKVLSPSPANEGHVGQSRDSLQVNPIKRLACGSLPTTLQEDFGRLLSRLRLYRSSLREDQVQEFECK
jgi:hypothetical protein